MHAHPAWTIAQQTDGKYGSWVGGGSEGPSLSAELPTRNTHTHTLHPLAYLSQHMLQPSPVPSVGPIPVTVSPTVPSPSPCTHTERQRLAHDVIKRKRAQDSMTNSPSASPVIPQRASFTRSGRRAPLSGSAGALTDNQASCTSPSSMSLSVFDTDSDFFSGSSQASSRFISASTSLSQSGATSAVSTPMSTQTGSRVLGLHALTANVSQSPVMRIAKKRVCVASPALAERSLPAASPLAWSSTVLPSAVQSQHSSFNFAHSMQQAQTLATAAWQVVPAVPSPSSLTVAEQRQFVKVKRNLPQPQQTATDSSATLGITFHPTHVTHIPFPSSVMYGPTAVPQSNMSARHHRKPRLVDPDDRTRMLHFSPTYVTTQSSIVKPVTHKRHAIGTPQTATPRSIPSKNDLAHRHKRAKAQRAAAAAAAAEQISALTSAPNHLQSSSFVQGSSPAQWRRALDALNQGFDGVHFDQPEPVTSAPPTQLYGSSAPDSSDSVGSPTSSSMHTQWSFSPASTPQSTSRSVSVTSLASGPIRGTTLRSFDALGNEGTASRNAQAGQSTSPTLGTHVRRALPVRRLGQASSNPSSANSRRLSDGLNFNKIFLSNSEELPRPSSEELRPQQPLLSPPSLPQHTFSPDEAASSDSDSVSSSESDDVPSSDFEDDKQPDERMAMSIAPGVGHGGGLHPTRVLAPQMSTRPSPSVDLTVRRQRNLNLMQTGVGNLPGGDDDDVHDAHSHSTEGDDEVEADDETSPSVESREDVLARLERLKQLERNVISQKGPNILAPGILRVSVQNGPHVDVTVFHSPVARPLTGIHHRGRSASASDRHDPVVQHSGDGSFVSSPHSAELPVTGLFTGLLKQAGLSPGSASVEARAIGTPTSTAWVA